MKSKLLILMIATLLVSLFSTAHATSYNYLPISVRAYLTGTGRNFSGTDIHHSNNLTCNLDSGDWWWRTENGPGHYSITERLYRKNALLIYAHIATFSEKALSGPGNTIDSYGVIIDGTNAFKFHMNHEKVIEHTYEGSAQAQVTGTVNQWSN